jgi:hypothetical protein
MFNRNVCLMLVGVLLFSTTPTFAAGPLADSVQRLAQANAQPTERRAVVGDDRGSALFWSGLTMLGAGTTLEILSFTSLKKETGGCVIDYYSYVCASETSTNTPVLITGLVVSALGGVMTDIGWKKMHPMITFGPRPSVGVRVGF